MTYKRETCLEYYKRRLSEGWKEIKRDGFCVVLLSPEGIERKIDLRNDTETLRPNAAGDENAIATQTPADSFPPADHWNKVNELDDGRYVTSDGNSYQRDLYNLPAPTGFGTINFIKIYFRCRESGIGDKYAKPSLKSNSTVTDGNEVALTEPWTTRSQQWNTNPANSQPWEWTDISALQIGVFLKGFGGAFQAMCSEVYVEIDYSAVIDETVYPPALGLVVAQPAPTITAEKNITLEPSALGLAISQPTPTQNYDYQLGVAALGLAVAPPVPIIKIGISVLLSALGLEAGLPSPALNYDYQLGVAALGLAVAPQIPVVSIIIFVEISTLGLALAQYEPKFGRSILANPKAYNGYLCFMEQYIKNKVADKPPLKLPDGTLWW